MSSAARGADRGPRGRCEARRRRGRRLRRPRPRRAAARGARRARPPRASPTCCVEGGPTLAGALFDAGEIDELRLFIAPVLLGAGEARAVLEGEGATRIADGLRPLAIAHESIGEDLLITARLREW